MNYEYQSTVGSTPCTYSSLRQTYDGKNAGGHIPNQGNYRVPNLCPNGSGPNYPPSYDTLTHGQKHQCGGYFGLKGAYPFASCNACNAPYTNRVCSSNHTCG